VRKCFRVRGARLQRIKGRREMELFLIMAEKLSRFTSQIKNEEESHKKMRKARAKRKKRKRVEQEKSGV
jgi:hypothetical protein